MALSMRSGTGVGPGICRKWRPARRGALDIWGSVGLACADGRRSGVISVDGLAAPLKHDLYEALGALHDRGGPHKLDALQNAIVAVMRFHSMPRPQRRKHAALAARMPDVDLAHKAAVPPIRLAGVPVSCRHVGGDNAVVGHPGTQEIDG